MKNLDASKNATVTTKSLSVTIVAPKSVIDQIEANDISADIDMSSINVTGSTEVPVTITCLLYTSTYYRSNTKRRLGEGIGSVGKLVCCGLSGYCRIFQQRLHYCLLYTSPDENIMVGRVCTCCHSNLLFSHRVMGAKRGGMAAMMALNP